MPTESAVSQLQREAISSSADLASTLRKAFAISKKLGLNEMAAWVGNELKGYYGPPDKKIPDYRYISISPRFFNPYRGWCPIIIQDSKTRELFCSFPLAQGIVDLIGLASSSEGQLSISYPPEMENLLRREMETQLEICGLISRSSVQAIVNSVQNLLLEWSIELDSAGVSGDGLNFSEAEKREAEVVTQHIYAQNIGTVGNISGGARIRSKQTANLSPNQDKIVATLKEIDRAVSLLPPSSAVHVARELELVRSELSSPARDPDRVRAALESIRTVCEGAAGNVAAAGILSLLASAI